MIEPLTSGFGGDFCKTAPAIRGVEPIRGPVGTLVTVKGFGFKNDDVVVASGTMLPEIALTTVVISSKAIVAEVPPIVVDLPANLLIRVRRGGSDSPFPWNGLSAHCGPGLVRSPERQ